MMNILHAILVCVSFQYGKSLYLRKISNTDIEVKNLIIISIKTRGSTNNTQVSDISFYNDNNIRPMKLYSDDPNFNIVYIIFANLTTVNQYSFTTASNNPKNDPITWAIYNSLNGRNWTMIDFQVDYPTPIDILTQTPKIKLFVSPMIRINDTMHYTSHTVIRYDRILYYLVLPITGAIIILLIIAIIVLCKKKQDIDEFGTIQTI